MRRCRTAASHSPLTLNITTPSLLSQTYLTDPPLHLTLSTRDIFFLTKCCRLIFKPFFLLLLDDSPTDNSPADNTPTDNSPNGQFARGKFAHGQFAHNYCFFVKMYEFMNKLTISTLHYVKIIQKYESGKKKQPDYLTL